MDSAATFHSRSNDLSIDTVLTNPVPQGWVVAKWKCAYLLYMRSLQANAVGNKADR